MYEMTIKDLAIICSRVVNQLRFESQLGLRSIKETDEIADRATIEALKIELAIRGN